MKGLLNEVLESFRELQDGNGNDEDNYYGDLNAVSLLLAALIMIALFLCVCIIWYACCFFIGSDPSGNNANNEDPPSEYYDEEDEGGVKYATVHDTSQRSGLQVATEIDD